MSVYQSSRLNNRYTAIDDDLSLVIVNTRNKIKPGGGLPLTPTNVMISSQKRIKPLLYGDRRCNGTLAQRSTDRARHGHW